MSAVELPITRRNHGRGHSYFDANGVKLPSVTTIISGGVPKPALVRWAARTAAEEAVDRWDELAALPISERQKIIADAPNARRNAAAARGTTVHEYAEKLVAGEEVAVPDELRGHVESCAKFLDEWDVRAMHTESTLVNVTHGYAGTLDLIADLPGMGWVLLDWKTNASGIFGDVALQLAAYRFATHIGAGSEEMPEVDSAAIVHVRADGYSLVPITAGPEQFRAFIAAMRVREFAESSNELVHDAIRPTAAL